MRAESSMLSAVRSRPGGGAAPAEQLICLKGVAAAGTAPMMLVRLPRPSTRNETSSPGRSILPISIPQQSGTVPSPMSSPGCKPSSRAQKATSASRLHTRGPSAVFPGLPEEPRRGSPLTLTSQRRPVPNSGPVSPGCHRSPAATTSRAIEVAKLLLLTKPKPTDSNSSACVHRAEKSLISTKPPMAAATSAGNARRETALVMRTATSSS
mmetsp:Transcript_29110/g.93843  ORF Transcript_29110/g.93843 Transcript_29110/m.93843 type:complete len:210 (-) Transcript_29110:622-1251(-)